MERVNLKNYDLKFTSLSDRTKTDMIVIHHTGNPTDDDLSALQIHQSHQALGWSGIGYHYVVRKDGTCEIGRPHWTIGAHAEGENWHTIGVHFSGNFEIGQPTFQQIECGSILLANICTDYGLNPYNAIRGHKDLMATACPGANLYSILNTIQGKTDWYMK